MISTMCMAVGDACVPVLPVVGPPSARPRANLQHGFAFTPCMTPPRSHSEDIPAASIPPHLPPSTAIPQSRSSPRQMCTTGARLLIFSWEQRFYAQTINPPNERHRAPSRMRSGTVTSEIKQTKARGSTRVAVLINKALHSLSSAATCWLVQ